MLHSADKIYNDDTTSGPPPADPLDSPCPACRAETGEPCPLSRRPLTVAVRRGRAHPGVSSGPAVRVTTRGSCLRSSPARFP